MINNDFPLCIYNAYVYIYTYMYNYVCNMMAIYAYSHSQTNLVVARNFEGLQVLSRQSTCYTNT
jgi:hypothetical protein